MISVRLHCELGLIQFCPSSVNPHHAGGQGDYVFHNINTIQFLINGTCSVNEDHYNYPPFSASEINVPEGFTENSRNLYQGILTGVLLRKQDYDDQGNTSNGEYEILYRPGNGTIKGGLARNFSPSLQLKYYYGDNYNTIFDEYSPKNYNDSVTKLLKNKKYIINKLPANLPPALPKPMKPTFNSTSYKHY